MEREGRDGAAPGILMYLSCGVDSEIVLLRIINVCLRHPFGELLPLASLWGNFKLGGL